MFFIPKPDWRRTTGAATFSAAADGTRRAEERRRRTQNRLPTRWPLAIESMPDSRRRAVNHDGRSNALTQPNRWRKSNCSAAAYRQAGIDPPKSNISSCTALER